MKGHPSSFYRFIKGKFVLISYEPDGDSLRFIADNLAHFDGLTRSHLLRPSKKDNSVQLRFQGIDAPELHYGSAEQPLGAEATNELLTVEMNFSDIQKKKTVVTASTPKTLTGGILTKAMEVHGRPISYVLLEKDLPSDPDGSTIHGDSPILGRTLNFQQLAGGFAYPLFYDSMPAPEQEQFRKAAEKARQNKLGIWKLDTTADFKLTDEASISPGAQLIFPKLFRRCTDFLKAKQNGFPGDLIEWLISTHGRPQGSEDDTVVTHTTSASPVEVKLSAALQQHNSHVKFQPDLLDISFIER